MLAGTSSKMLWPLKKQMPMPSTQDSIMICSRTLEMVSKVSLRNSKSNSSTRSSFQAHASAVPLRSEHKQVQPKDQAKAMACTEQLSGGRMPHHICWIGVQRPTNSTQVSLQRWRWPRWCTMHIEHQKGYRHRTTSPYILEPIRFNSPQGTQMEPTINIWWPAWTASSLMLDMLSQRTPLQN